MFSRKKKVFINGTLLKYAWYIRDPIENFNSLGPFWKSVYEV
jgi:hypothetical protein